MKKNLLILLAGLSLTGCMSSEGRFARFVDGLNERQWKGCYANNVNFAAGFGGAGSITASGYILTGGMSSEECIALRTNRLPQE